MFLILLTRSRPHTHLPNADTPHSCCFSPAFLYTTPTRAHHGRGYLSVCTSICLLVRCPLLLPSTHTSSFSSLLLTLETKLLPTLTLPHCPHTFLRSIVFARNASLLHLPTALPSFPSMGERRDQKKTYKTGTALAPPVAVRTNPHHTYCIR